jgi:hypothetical protein
MSITKAEKRTSRRKKKQKETAIEERIIVSENDLKNLLDYALLRAREITKKYELHSALK